MFIWYVKKKKATSSHTQKTHITQVLRVYGGKHQGGSTRRARGRLTGLAGAEGINGDLKLKNYMLDISWCFILKEDASVTYSMYYIFPDI